MSLLWPRHCALPLTSGFFIVGGLAHLLMPDFFIQIMPVYLPWHFQLVFVSGISELLGGILIWFKPIRWYVGWALITLSVLVFPANVNMAINHTQFSNIPLWLLYLRLPLQGLIIYIIYISMRPAPEDELKAQDNER